MPFPQMEQGSCNIFSHGGFRFIFVVENVLDIFSQGFLFLSLARARRGSFSDLHCEDLVEFMGVKTHESCPLQYWGPQKFLIPLLVHTQPPAIHQNYHLNVPTALWLQQLVTQVSRFDRDFLDALVSSDFRLALCPVTSVL